MATYLDFPSHSETENDASDLAFVAGPSSVTDTSSVSQTGSPPSRKRRKISHGLDPSHGDRLVLCYEPLAPGHIIGKPTTLHLTGSLPVVLSRRPILMLYIRRKPLTIG